MVNLEMLELKKNASPCFFYPFIIRDITMMTNNNINNFLDRLDQRQMELVRTKNVRRKTTTEDELYAYLGMMYLCGAYK